MDAPAASQASMEELRQEVSDLSGIELHRVVKVDFIGFKEAVDALGGVDIEVPETIVDTTYPGPNYSYQTFTIYAGPQHLDGETALKYARSRHSTSDFSRSARQQQLISAIVHRAKEKGILGSPSTITSLYQTVQKNMETTMTLREMIGLAKLGLDIDRNNITTFQINSTSGLGNGASAAGGFLYTPPRENFQGAFVLLPVAYQGLEDWDSIRTFVHLVITERKLFTQKPMVDVLNAGAQSGLARTLGSDILRNGFELNELRNADIPDQETSSIIVQTASGAIFAPIFEDLLGLPIREAPLELDPVELGDITILLGKDYAYQSIASRKKTVVTSSSGSVSIPD
jgi:LCP family protein required for cell wall assembly